jgi:hypothetical protein
MAAAYSSIDQFYSYRSFQILVFRACLFKCEPYVLRIYGTVEHNLPTFNQLIAENFRCTQY